MIKIDKDLLDKISLQAKESPRKRQNYNFHTHSDDLLQRMLNAMEPGTYVRPHKHVEPFKREVFLIIRGSTCLIEFDEHGNITDKYVMTAGTGNEGAEITPGAYHSLVSLQPGTIIYEIKDGPWDAKTDKIFAPWAPEEGSPDSERYYKSILEKVQPSF